MSSYSFRLRPLHLVAAILIVCVGGGHTVSAQQSATSASDSLFRQDNLVAWCIVPFDSQKRSPKQRAEMLRELSISKFAYDYRAEHVSSFEEEILCLKEKNIELSAWWFPGELNEEAKSILALLKKYQQKPQLWVMGGGNPRMTPDEANAFVESEVKRLRPIADAGAEAGCKLALYNHGGWFGIPENLVRLVKAIDRPNVGIVYNMHHAHDELSRLPEVLDLLKPYLLCLNINGMQTDGEKIGKKILIIGQGDQDPNMIRAILASGYSGPIGILNHTDEDARIRLQANMNGLRQVLQSAK